MSNFKRKRNTSDSTAVQVPTPNVASLTSTNFNRERILLLENTEARRMKPLMMLKARQEGTEFNCKRAQITTHEKTTNVDK